MVFAWTDGVPALLYHGQKLEPSIDLEALAAAFARPLLQATLDVNDPVSLHPEGSRGFAGHPALIGSRQGRPPRLGRAVQGPRHRCGRPRRRLPSGG